MKPAGYGETQPRLADDRMPVVLVTLDGLGDRAIGELGGQTPDEAADTPVLDALTSSGMSGWHIPFGWGPAPASEISHWAMFGFSDIAFPGRAVLEGLGDGIDLADESSVTFASIRASRQLGDEVWITGRAASADAEDAAALFDELEPLLTHFGLAIRRLRRSDEVLLVLDDVGTANISDSDPFFETFHPWLRVVPTAADGQQTADVMNDFLLAARAHLAASDANTARRKRGLPALDTVTTKWSGTKYPIPSFVDITGVRGAAVTSSRLYRGLAELLSMTYVHEPVSSDHGADIEKRLSLANDLITEGARFVHVHTKATDEAGHTKDPVAKRDVLEALDAGLSGLGELSTRAVVAVTGDHATPSVNGVLHTSDPTPILVAGPTVRADDVMAFGQKPMRSGWLGNLPAKQLLPLLFSFANRPTFLGHRPTARRTLALPDSPEPMRVDTPARPMSPSSD